MIPPTSYIKGSSLTAFVCTPTVLCSQAAALCHQKIRRKMLRLSTLALPLLAACFGGLVLGELSNDFSQCLDFFYNSTPPQGFNRPQYQPICQRYQNRYRFASLYDRERRAPLYSAYQLKLADGRRPKVPWMYEPQLAFSRATPDMKPFETLNVDQNVIESQAVLEDYKNSSFTKGHLNPSMHQETKEDREATFSLTNIVPQKQGSNSGPWSILENEVLKKFKNYCNGSMYVITGAVPYSANDRWLRNRVSVPEYMWSAYCCPSFSAKLPNSMKPFFPAYAAVGRNDPESGEEIVPVNMKARPSVRGYDVKRMSLSALEGFLSERLAASISLFDGECEERMESPELSSSCF
ncbi:endonuclease domain-containing 1 protein-like isoform X1 [Takifugu flavidus]|nr:endonuclease domain-containing 1 protein-like isoform X1 [Takifugu flavidus]